MFFTLLAVLLSVTAFAARTAAGVLERRPGWALILLLLTAACVMVLRHRRRRFSPARAALRAAAALDEASRAAADFLEAAPSPAGAALAGTGTGPGPLLFVDTPGPGAFVDTSEPGGPRAATLVDDVTRALGRERTDAERAGPVIGYDALDPDAFEEAVAALCERDGCTEVEVVGGAGDLGADVLAVAPDGRRVVIQCKRYGEGNTVGSQDLQRFGGTCFAVHEAEVAVVVTTSDFTAPAAEYAEQCGILCWDRTALRTWSDGTGPRPWEQPPA